MTGCRKVTQHAFDRGTTPSTQPLVSAGREQQRVWTDLIFRVSKFQKENPNCSFTRGAQWQTTNSRTGDTTLLLYSHTLNKKLPWLHNHITKKHKYFIWRHKQPDKQQGHHRRDWEKRLSKILPYQWETLDETHHPLRTLVLIGHSKAQCSSPPYRVGTGSAKHNTPIESDSLGAFDAQWNSGTCAEWCVESWEHCWGSAYNQKEMFVYFECLQANQVLWIQLVRNMAFAKWKCNRMLQLSFDL